MLAADFNLDAGQNEDDAITQAWLPFTGNIFSKLFRNLESRKENFLKILPILFRQPFWAWPRTIRMITKHQKP